MHRGWCLTAILSVEIMVVLGLTGQWSFVPVLDWQQPEGTETLYRQDALKNRCSTDPWR